MLAGSAGTRLPLTGLLERQLGAAVARAGGGALAGLDERARESLLPRGGAVLRGLCAALHDSSILVQRGVLDVPAPPLCTIWTRRIPHPVLIGHAASLTPYYGGRIPVPPRQHRASPRRHARAFVLVAGSASAAAGAGRLARRALTRGLR